MKFYEFNEDFGYYALIGAETEEKAVEYYKETVADIEDEDSIPTEITRYKAKKKFLSVFENANDKLKSSEEFQINAEKDEPYLILVDGSLF